MIEQVLFKQFFHDCFFFVLVGLTRVKIYQQFLTAHLSNNYLATTSNNVSCFVAISHPEIHL